MVEVIRDSPKMSIKQLIAKFKEFLKTKEQKAQFMNIVKVVAKLVQEGDEKIVVLARRHRRQVRHLIRSRLDGAHFGHLK